MATVDLSTPPADAADAADAPGSPDSTAAPDPALGTLEGLPRRLALTLPELQYFAEAAGNAPLPFDVVAPSTPSSLEDRLGQSKGGTEDDAYLAALEGLNDPAETLAKRGLLVEGTPDAGVVGALGLLAKPVLAVDLDVTAAGVHAKAWHRQSSAAVAALATSDGLVFELAWFEPDKWAGELARVAAVPEDLELEDSSQVPGVLDLPFELLEGCGEALRTQRADLVPVIVAAHSGQVRDGAGRVLDDAVVAKVVGALASETQGRLRGLAADVGSEGAPVVGVVSWVLLADGWRSVRTHQIGQPGQSGQLSGDAPTERRVEVRQVEPADLGALLAPVLAEVSA